ncbi:hypothetical protein L0337_38250 [candidate division KSB1 bacterium]|nr:hypothetical protein [candidate division KSB1 bacterium]
MRENVDNDQSDRHTNGDKIEPPIPAQIKLSDADNQKYAQNSPESSADDQYPFGGVRVFGCHFSASLVTWGSSIGSARPTPLLSRAPRSFAKPAHSFSRRLQHGVGKDSLPFTTIFLPELKYSFCLFHELAFLLSQTLSSSTKFSSLPSRLFVLARYFAFFAAFKMGVNARTCNRIREASTFTVSKKFKFA